MRGCFAKFDCPMHYRPNPSLLKPLRTVLLSFVACAMCIQAWADEPQENAPQAEVLQLGQTVYIERCASCHGDVGAGVEGAYEEPLTGDLPVGELAALITETMPQDEAETCVGEDAAAVAAYVYDSFYSEAARIRNRPPRIVLARLTATQLRQSLADLYASFEAGDRAIGESGLRGEYFSGARPANENKKIDRVDSGIDFNWGHEGPGEGVTAEDFSVRWRGALRVEATGRYEIIVQSTCAFICYLGADDREFINNYTQSGEKTEFRQSIVLTAGQPYPLRIDLFQRKRKTEQPPAEISLSWRPPGGVEEIVPARNLLTSRHPAVFSLQTTLPADDRSYGYERGIAVDRSWDESTTAAAIEFTQAALDELWPRYQTRQEKNPNENRARLRDFLTHAVETAFRGPVEQPLRELYVDQQMAATEDDAEAIKRSLLITLKSPRFLYPELDAEHSPSQQVANRLALTLFDSLPSDRWLLDLVENDQLETREQVRDAASRMVDDLRTRAKTYDMVRQWLNLREETELVKNAELFPEFDAELAADLKTSFDAFLDDMIWSDSSDFRQLFLADWAYTNERLAGYYGRSWQPADPNGVGIRPSIAEPDYRFGLLTHPYLMSRLSYQDSTSPIHRGVFLIRYMLGRVLRPPNEAFTPLSPDLEPELTTRERVALQTSAESCQVCHVRINGLGFVLENFDAVGRFRTAERNKPIDASGNYSSREDLDIGFKGPSELAHYLANSEDAQRAFVDRAFQHFVKQPAAAYGPNTIDLLLETFQGSDYNIRELFIEIAVVAANDQTDMLTEDN